MSSQASSRKCRLELELDAKIKSLSLTSKQVSSFTFKTWLDFFKSSPWYFSSSWLVAISLDIYYFDEIRKLNYMIHVVLRKLIFHLFTISLSFFVIFFFVLIKCRIYDFYNERFSNEKKKSRSHEFSTFNDLSFNDLNFEINHSLLILYNLLFVINHSQNYVNIFNRFEKQIIVNVRHDVCETTE